MHSLGGFCVHYDGKKVSRIVGIHYMRSRETSIEPINAINNRNNPPTTTFGINGHELDTILARLLNYIEYMCWVVGVTRWPEGRISSPFTFLYSFLLVFLFIEIETLNTHKGEKREGKLCVYLGETMAFLLPQLRSLHMDDRGLNKHNAIMFLNNKTIGISWDIPMSVVVQVRCWGESVTTTSMRMGRKERKFTRPNIIQLAENILNIYGSSFHRYMDLLFTFHSSSLHSLFFSSCMSTWRWFQLHSTHWS